MTQLEIPAVPPPRRRGIDLRLCSCADPEWLAACEGAVLAICDPPWSYRGGVVDAGSEAVDHYAGVSTAGIAAMISAIPVPAYAVWCTWPCLQEWIDAFRCVKYRTGGSWSKSWYGDSGHFGTGHYLAGCSEPVLLYGGFRVDKSMPVRGSWPETWTAPPDAHSRKPAQWMAQWLRKWTEPGDLVVDPFAGLGAVAEAVILAGEGRRYLGAEIDPERHSAALALLAQVRA